jgi:hypothetical protein
LVRIGLNGLITLNCILDNYVRCSEVYETYLGRDQILDFLEHGDELSADFLVRFEALTTVKIPVVDLWVAVPCCRYILE